MSFVYLSAGAPFAKSGSYEMGIPKLDVPVSILTWEVFLPDRLEVRQFGGNALSASLFPASAQSVLASNEDDREADLDVWTASDVDTSNLVAGQVAGIVVDPAGAVISGALVSVVNPQTGATLTTKTDGEGRWVVSGVRPGPVRVQINSQGFKSFQQEMDFSASRPAKLGVTLEVGAVSESVTVTAGQAGLEREGKRIEEQLRKNKEATVNAPSQNVFNLQRRVAGVLPVRVDVPRAGKSYRFVRPLVLEEETKISFQYKTR